MERSFVRLPEQISNEQAKEVIAVTLRELALLRERVPEEELERAKNILIAGIYANVERQSDRLE